MSDAPKNNLCAFMIEFMSGFMSDSTHKEERREKNEGGKKKRENK